MVGDILQPTHLLFVLVVALLVLGPKRLPEVGRTLGNGIRDFRSAINGETPEKREEIDDTPWKPDPDPDPETKHEFAHQAETLPDSHEFAHEEPSVSAAPTQTEAPAEVVQPHPAGSAAETTVPSPKHEFAHESSESTDSSANHPG
jgi:sec-independent protein translocase protein TatA